jgi:fumarate hydratase subunit alpha
MENRYHLIENEIERLVIEAGIKLPDDVMTALQDASADPGLSKPGALVLSRILENLEIARTSRLPMCQDTGMAVVFIDLGAESEIKPSELEESVRRGVKTAYENGFFRKSIVEDPVYGRKNTGDNLPVLFHLRSVPGEQVKLSIMLKGFGSENCSSLVMLNPTDGEEGILKAISDSMQRAGGKPCPPVIIGVGIGGTAEQAMILSKRALLRDVGSPHPQKEYAQLEKALLKRVNELDIGPGGLGGAWTALGVLIEREETHIAGMPVGVSISCWADRKAVLTLDARGRIL